MNPQAYSSALGPTIGAYIAFMRALGRSYKAMELILAQLDRFLAQHYPEHAVLTHDSFRAWSLTLAARSAGVRRLHLATVRNFCIYMRRSVPGCFVPDRSTFPPLPPRHRPHIFMHEQIAQLLRATANLKPTGRSPLHPDVLRIALVLLYTAGLRRGELVRLALSDYDPAERTLHIRESKFHKSRLVALSNDAVRELERYLEIRRRLPQGANSPLLANCYGVSPGYKADSLSLSLRNLFKRENIRTPEGRIPHVHDIRHCHAVHVLLRWYRAGIDVQSKLIILSRAMGHGSVRSTAYYLSCLEPVAELACERFALHCRQILDGQTDGGTADA